MSIGWLRLPYEYIKTAPTSLINSYVTIVTLLRDSSLNS